MVQGLDERTEADKRPVITDGERKREFTEPTKETKSKTKNRSRRIAGKETVSPEAQDFSDKKQVTPIEILQPETRPEDEPLIDRATKDRWQLSDEARELAKGEVAIMAVTILSLVNGLATMALGDNAVMNNAERQMISEPLERILDRMDSTTKGFLTKYADPFLLVTGLIAWGSRIRRENLEQEQEANEIEAGEQKMQEKVNKNNRPKPIEIESSRPFDYSKMNANIGSL